MSMLTEIKRQEAAKSLAVMMKQYTAVSKQLRLETNEVTKVTLQEQLTDLEEQITQKEVEIGNLETQLQTNTASSPVVEPDRIQLYQILYNYFNIAELDDLYFQLGIDPELVGVFQNRQEMARELIEYCRRHNRLDELINKVHELRPNE